MTDVVIGAGLAGLTFAYFRDNSPIIFEKEQEVGGLVRTISTGRYKFDLAPHLLHLKRDWTYEFITSELGVNLQAHARKARICVENRIIPYPFELNLKGVSDHIRGECLKGLESIAVSQRQDNELRSGSYGDYVLKAFGNGIAKYYLLPYNRKIWDTDPFDMTCDFMRHLPTADIEKIRRNAFEENTDAFGYNTSFFYPEHSGIREIADALATNIQSLKLGTKVCSVSLQNRKVFTSDGLETSFDRLISTIPLRDLAFMSDHSEAKELAAGLNYTSVYVVNVVIEGKVPNETQWLYFPDPKLSFYRISFPTSYFSNSAPKGQHILSVEIGSRIHDLDPSVLEDKVVNELKSLPIFKINRIVKIHTERIACAYVIYDRERKGRVERIKDIFLGHGVISIGRYGNWEYAGMEDAIVQGREFAHQFNML
jgi:protoporphyrinogen oxidase